MSKLRVFYDGGCPLCRKEISVYQQADRQDRIDWFDVSNPAADLPLPQSTLLARFHVQKPDGALVSGARAFIEVWLRLPGWRWLGFIARLPGVPGLLEVGYLFFLKLRPRLQRWLRP
jgi:predicted DCC family thiol-disulfide oxidoreductase YuxK